MEHNNDDKYPLQLPAKTSKLLRTIEASQLGFSQNLQGPYGARRMVYTDYTASGKSLSFIEDYIRSEVLPTYANTHTTTTDTGRQTTHYREQARQLIKCAMNCSEEDVLVFVGSGCTGALDKLLRCLCIHDLPLPPIVFVSPFEHHANLLPWREAGADVVWIAEDYSGKMDIVDLERKLQHYSGSGRQLIGSLSAASNITGVLTDTLRFSALLHKYGALSFWDYASAAPYIKMDMNPQTEGVDEDLEYKDAIFFSTHKFVGGPDTPGVLVAKKKLFCNRPGIPSIPAGGTVSFVTPTKQYYWDKIELREEGGTPAIIGSIRAGLVMQLKERVGSEQIEALELVYTQKFLKHLSGMQELYVTGPHAVPKLPIFSFVVRHSDSGRFLHHNYVSSILNDVFGIQTRGGCMCAGPYAQIVLGIDEPLAQRYIMEGSHYPEEMREALKPGVTRLSFPYFMSEEVVEFVIEAVRMTTREGWKLLPQYDFAPETGTFHNSQLSTSDRRLSCISYTSCGEMSYPKQDTSPEAPSFEVVLDEAQKLFDQAMENSMGRSSQLAQDYSSLMLLGKEMEEMRWFMVPYEAHLCLTNCHLPKIQVPFKPRNYEHDNWYSKEYLNEWDKHWNPSFWEETKAQRSSEKSTAVITRSYRQLTIYPADQRPRHKIQLQPITDEPSSNSRAVRRKVFVSMEQLHVGDMRSSGISGSTGSLASPRSSGYSSDHDVQEDTEEAVVRRKTKRRRRKIIEIVHSDDTRHGKKCVVM